MPDTLNPERVAYWYFRLNGFFQIENFVVHPGRGGSQRTDADLLGVRFPHRAERLFDDPDDVMHDDAGSLVLSDKLIDVIIAEVKTNQPCTLNGPWTRDDKQNIHRVLAAIGCLPAQAIEKASADIYREGIHRSSTGYVIRLLAIGREHNQEIATRYPKVVQLTWVDLLSFIWARFDRYRRQKTQVDQWDAQGQLIKRLADGSDNADAFVKKAQRQMGLNAP